MNQNINYENFLNLESLIKDSQRNTEMLLELYFRLTADKEADDAGQSSSLSEGFILNTLRSVHTNLVGMEISLTKQLNNLKK